MKIQIQPLAYRAGTGVYLEVVSVYGNPPLTVKWQITTDVGHPLESGEFQIGIDQWQNWPIGPDTDYIEKIAAAYLSVTPL